MVPPPTSPPGSSGGGGGFISGLLGRAARAAIDHYSGNSTANSTSYASTGGGNNVQSSRSFFDLYGGADTTYDSGSVSVVEYSGRAASDEIATIYPISLRAGDLILHGPRKATDTPSSYPLFNIILHAANRNSSSEKMFSLFRTESEAEASRMFVIYKQIIPDLVKASSSQLDRSTLEKILKLVKQYESYSAPHVAAALGMLEQLKSPIIRDKFIDQEGKLLHTPLHVSCVHGKLDSFKTIAEDERLFNRIYDIADLKGNTILHLAADCREASVGASILRFLKEKLQQTGPQQAHSHRILQDLFLKLNNEGKAPIHIACMNSHKEIVDELTTFSTATTSHSASSSKRSSQPTPFPQVIVNSALLDIKDASTGYTPLHLTTAEPALLSHLLTIGSDPNVTDNDGLTPLHKAVLEQNLKSTLQLLSNKAYTNFTATYQRYKDATPLHLAASIGALHCLKALIVFGADLEVKDGNGHTARHIISTVFTGSNIMKQDALFVLSAAGAKRCGLGSGGCSEGCRHGGKNDGKKPDNWRIKRDGTSTSVPDNGHILREAMRGLSIIKESYDNGMHMDGSGTRNGPVVGGRLLSLDGGGIRGLVLTVMLFFIEKEFDNTSGCGAPIVSYFDWVAGTSTGGIMALALACGKSVLETQSLYIKLKDKVFTGDRPYSANRMEQFLKAEFGAETKMSSIQKPKVMIMTALANRKPPDLYIFRNYLSPSYLVGEPEEYAQLPEETFVWETAKVTGAAPSYFTLEHELFIDGGLISNNPTMDALTELIQFRSVMMGSNQNARSGDWKVPAVVVTLGTGIPPKQERSATMLDVQWPTGVFDAIKNVPRLQHLIHLLVDQATQSEGQVVERARAWCASMGVPFFRFSPEMSEDIDLDEKDDEALINLMWETWCFMVGNRGEVREIYERLREADITTKADQRKSHKRMET